VLALQAVISVFKVGGNFDIFPFTIAISIGLCFYLMFSPQFARLSRNGGIFGLIGKLGVLPMHSACRYRCSAVW
jgi:hypothetical protein